MNGDEIRIRETTQDSVSGHLVGVSNIWDMDLPDDSGVIAPRMSANLSIGAPDPRHSRQERVRVGSLVSLGADRYRVAAIEQGDRAPGWLTLRKIL